LTGRARAAGDIPEGKLDSQNSTGSVPPADHGWLGLPGTADDLLASRPENPTPITVPSLSPREDGTGPFTFGKKMWPKLSGWARKIVSDEKLRKTKATAGTRLLALALAAQTDVSGRLGSDGHGIWKIDARTAHPRARWHDQFLQRLCHPRWGLPVHVAQRRPRRPAGRSDGSGCTVCHGP
jgi:hypothetical protein